MYYWLSPYELINAYNNWVYSQMMYTKALYQPIGLQDYGPDPFVFDAEEFTEQNTNFRTILWTGEHLQVALMNINIGEDIGMEMHPDVDQFFCIEEGQGLIMMGDIRDNLYFREYVDDGTAFIVPAGKWHNLVNTGKEPLKLYTIYAPPQHPFGTIHKTKRDAQY